MKSIANLEWRYAVKKFDDQKILEQQKINILKQAFNLTATSYGLQPIKLLIIKNKSIQRKLVDHSYHQQQIVQASHLLVICIDTNLKESDVEKYFERVKEIRKTPDETISSFREYLKTVITEKSSQDLILWAKNQAYLALGNLLTVCANEKIDSCPMEGFIPKKYDEILGLKEKNLTSVLVVPIGYRAEDDMKTHQMKVRKKIEEIVIEIS
ncbi:NAD(P)H-dependent oxidoreductase [Flavobacteriaceae bacterium]|jgi:nitroreductase|nr:NAD(P)H-dependent oxidoreductase [Flavobacteriaceae bacterium]MDB4497369.1 NAD(P)H-dependent oxidoreductase [Flavobacteriaceae bacterium]MDC1168490.1 NAD(P)H-dependent oxidoreductase [Flavobacteriaceae bacterium]MDC3318632.1 NAD(P)H-dependent oxidoreductase [Flavobacteriaceae bacterium]